MRVPTLLSIFALASVAVAQRPAEIHEATVWDAYQNFRVNDTLTFEITGTDTYGRTSTPVRAILYYRLSTDPRTGIKNRAEVDLGIFEYPATGEQLSMRIVGDGTSLYRYDLRKREVVTTKYGFYGDVAPTDASTFGPAKLFSQLRSVTPGVVNYLVRLVGEMNPAGIEFAPRYADWLPGRSRQFFDEVPVPMRQFTGIKQTDTVTDPITGRVFVRGDDRFVFYGMDRADTDRTVSFRIYDADPTPGDGIERWEVLSLNIGLRGPNRVLDLTIAPTTGTIPAGAFEPFSGSMGNSFRPVHRAP